ncbi:hypothetical protein GLE_5529 [Lysobacter enzymogenes]|uniref:Uncharacterized protein n=1 Tax=Lysobacter enzymogenes TaxID=69 RepID=A0A0S2DQJ5_LYSEN|nr:hypothetical protein GLE_5529 [Lysobacter enzymogenes]
MTRFRDDRRAAGACSSRSSRQPQIQPMSVQSFSSFSSRLLCSRVACLGVRAARRGCLRFVFFILLRPRT